MGEGKTLTEGARRRRVLIVEDEPLSAELGRLLLEDLGLVVETVARGDDAVARARGEPFDLVLMDFLLPDLNWPEAAAAIRRDTTSASREAPIIAVTASEKTDDHEACLAAGMNYYLLKPLGREALAIMLVKWRVVDAERLDPPASPPSSLKAGFDPSRIANLRSGLARADFCAVVEKAVTSLDEHLRAIGKPNRPDDERRILHRVVSLSHDLGFVDFGASARALEQLLGDGHAVDPAARNALIQDGHDVLRQLRNMIEAE